MLCLSTLCLLLPLSFFILVKFYTSSSRKELRNVELRFVFRCCCWPLNWTRNNGIFLQQKKNKNVKVGACSTPTFPIAL